MVDESNAELAFLDTLLKQNNGENSVLVYRKPTHTEQYLHYRSHHQTSCKDSIVSSLLNRAYSIITNKDDLHKENTRIKQVLKENEYQKSIISKTFTASQKQSQLTSVTTTNASHKYPRGRDQNEYKFTVR